MTLRERLGHLIWPLMLITIGGILLLYNLGVINVDLWEAILGLWPLLIVALALNMVLVGGTIFFPLALIAFALAFLLDNLKVVDLSMWPALAKLWPLLIVAAGVDVLVGVRLRGGAQRTEEFSQPLEGAAAAEIKIEPGVGRFNLAAGAATDALFSGVAHVGPGEHVQYSAYKRQNELRAKLRQHAEWFFIFGGAWSNDRQWQISLNPVVPISLKIDGGLGPRTIDLRGLNLARLKLEGGLGATDVILPERGKVRINIDGGLGDMTVRIPAAMAVRMKVDEGLGRRQIHGSFTRQDKYYISAGYDAAADRVDLDIDQGLGGLTIVYEA